VVEDFGLEDLNTRELKLRELEMFFVVKQILQNEGLHLHNTGRYHLNLDGWMNLKVVFCLLAFRLLQPMMLLEFLPHCWSYSN
jgi:hypothetical protein